MRRVPRTLLAIVLAATLLPLLPGCVVIRRDGPPPKWLPGIATTSSVEATVTAAKTSAKKTSGTTVYLARGGRLVAVTRDGKPTVETAMDLLLAGPSAEERKAGVGTAIPGGTGVRAVSVDYGGHANVDLTRDFAKGGNDRALRVAQVVYTLTEVPGVQSVILTIDGKRVERFGPLKNVLRTQKRTDYREFAP
jgi:spore germination protein GerM